MSLFIPYLSSAQVDPSFNPNKLIDDKIFSDTKTFGGPEGVQKFLEAKNSVLANVSPDFLSKLKEPDSSLLKQGLDDPRPNLGRIRTAAELIWDVATQSGINPQVILVTLNKEQSLVDGRKNASPQELQKALDRALGFDCPDSTGCGDLFPGFYYQLFGNYDSSGNRYLGAAKSLMKSFSAQGGRGPSVDGKISRVGDTIVLDNTQGPPNNADAKQNVNISNNATAALYRFTPHVFNGNYNFWKFFNSWFRYANGTLLKLSTITETYIIQNGVKQLVPPFVALARSLNLNTATIVSPNEFESYSTDKVLGPLDNTIVSVSGENKTYVFLANVKHPASSFVISQRGLDPSKVLSITLQESSLFETGAVLTPKDGSIVRGLEDKTVYLVQGGKIKIFSNFTFAQRNIKAKDVVVVPDLEILSYEKNGFVAPLDGTLVKSLANNTVYLVENGLKHPVIAEVFKNRGFSIKKVAVISQEEIGALAIGSYATPADRTFFTLEKSTNLFMFKEGTKHSISTFVAKQKHITADYVFNQSVAGEWFDGIPMPPLDNTLLKGDKSQAVYLVAKGQLRPLTATAYMKRKIKAKSIVVLPQDEVESYAKGETLEK